MENKKMSLANVQGKLSRAEMKNVMAGSTTFIGNPLNPNDKCWGIACVSDYTCKACYGYFVACGCFNNKCSHG